MSKSRTIYTCQACACVSPRWVGKCPNCGGWNTFLEEKTSSRTAGPGGSGRKKVRPIPITEVQTAEEPRISTRIAEMDRVLGGGIVAGSVVLVGGDPGIGKSTLMLQMAAAVGDRTTMYVTGEESAAQIRLRSERLETAPSRRLLLLPETDLSVIVPLLESSPCDLVIVDSVQTMHQPELESAPGTVSQVREATSAFLRFAKERGVPVFLVGHVTKEGVIAGPRVIEHMVDTVLQFEGDRHHSYRILRAVKNRFGSTNEIGIFEMRDRGLSEVANPSEVFLAERSAGAAGSAVTCSMEGTRPLLLELQALVAPARYGLPQRSSNGFDTRRLQMLLAVLERRVGLHLGQSDVFVNVAGGVRIEEPAADLGMAAAIVSSLREAPVDSLTVSVGEVGLGGEIRTVGQMEKRVAEASKLGFTRVIVPRLSARSLRPPGGVSVVGVETIEEALAHLTGKGRG
ncbi:MAG: DNA repair protein RadA [Bacteroidota bacterium]